ncbi:MAG: SIR2 family protein [Acidobacteriaceae bacterium]|nr:SIR2 family protein [Acidobacteriaceae bacterium]
MNIPETLVQAVREKKAILFAGAGLSCTLGLPLFDVLTSYLGSQLKLPDWERHDFPALAEYYLLQTSASDELFQWMRKQWHRDNIDITASRAHNCILDLNFPVLYTTNYDSWLECAYAARGVPFRKVLSVSDLAETSTSETEIIKFHGDFDDPSSIVLTESSFLRRMSLDGPLDIRLRSDSLARPLLFAGYSVSDPNIRYLLFKLQELWAGYSEAWKKPKSYILMVERNEVQERLLCERGVEPIVSEESNASLGLVRFFEALLGAVQSDHDDNRQVQRHP